MNIIKTVLDTIFPENLTCEICGREIFDGGRLCSTCADTVFFNDGETCPVCGRKTETAELCQECKELAPLFDKAVSPLIYADGGRKLVVAFKNGKPYLKEYFADLMAKKCTVFTDADGICFVPMTARERRKRGYNQAGLLAAALSKRLKLPLLKGALVKTKNTPSQKTLTRKEREQNLLHCFRAVKEEVNGKTLILVDDVMTTGATADAVCRQLKKCGAKKIYFVTAASVEYKAPNNNN